MRLRSLEVSYGQIAVFLSDLQQPFNDWTDLHVRQGFAWRQGSVSFATLEHAGSIDVEVQRQAPSIGASKAARIIAVPFEVDAPGAVEVASIADGEAISLPPGSYRLTFEHGLNDAGGMWCRISFEPTKGSVPAQLVRVDIGLSPGEHLIMEAHPAET